MQPIQENCRFCQIATRSVGAAVVFEGKLTMAFLDYRPLFPGHVLLIPRAHYETLVDVPADVLQPLFADAQLLSRAVQESMGADGIFIAINNRVSQSVPHLHVHVVPRRFSDGLKGFFWPRQRYESPEAMQETARAIAECFGRLRAEQA